MPFHGAIDTFRRFVSGPTLLLALAATLLIQAGCINVMAITSKVLFGDPTVMSAFQQRTEVSLADGHTIGLICTAPASVTGEFDAMHFDVQAGVIRRMRVRGLDVVDSDQLISALDDSGGRFDPQSIADSMPEVDYLLHVELARFTAYEEASPNLYRGRARGTVVGYEVRRNEETGAAHPIPVFQQDFNIEYPASHPLSTDQMSQSSFVRRCIDEISDDIGLMFYDVPTSELY